MEVANYEAVLPSALADARVFAPDPFVLVDVGCSGGIDPLWRLFGDDLRAYGLDPQVGEIERLRREEMHPGVSYHAAFVELPESHPIVRRRGGRAADADLLAAVGATSAAAAARRVEQRSSAIVWRCGELARERVALADFLRRHDVDRVDVVKSDTDGSDFDVLLSFDELIDPVRVLGFMLEVPLVGTADESSSTLHNVDRLLKARGFELVALEIARYSRAVLPAPFEYALFAQTRWGQPLWADVVYLREPPAPAEPVELLKLACLYELFRLPDRAAELLQAHRAALDLVDVDALLDLLTPPLGDRRVSYREYVAAFEADPTRFFPAPEVERRPRRRRWRR